MLPSVRIWSSFLVRVFLVGPSDVVPNVGRPRVQDGMDVRDGEVNEDVHGEEGDGEEGRMAEGDGEEVHGEEGDGEDEDGQPKEEDEEGSKQEYWLKAGKQVSRVRQFFQEQKLGLEVGLCLTLKRQS